jgi:hypothetical protein
MRLMAARFVDVHPRTAWCPTPGCGTSIFVGGAPTSVGRNNHTMLDPDNVILAVESGRGLAVTCGQCYVRFCFECMQSPPHEPATCKQVGAEEGTAPCISAHR